MGPYRSSAEVVDLPETELKKAKYSLEDLETAAEVKIKKEFSLHHGIKIRIKRSQFQFKNYEVFYGKANVCCLSYINRANEQENLKTILSGIEKAQKFVDKIEKLPKLIGNEMCPKCKQRSAITPEYKKFYSFDEVIEYMILHCDSRRYGCGYDWEVRPAK